MDNSLLDFGVNCSLEPCSTHDFLPIFCTDCSKYFCKDHIHSDLHICPSLHSNPDIQRDKLQRCALDECNKLSLDAYSSTASTACQKCNKSFCADHRHPISHKCLLPVVHSSSADIPQKNEKARALLAKISSSSTSRIPAKKNTKEPTDPVKLEAYRKVQAMKMRHKAVPLDPKDKSVSLALDQRLHLKVQHNNQEKVFWVRKTLIAGKVLDLLSDQFAIKNNLLSYRLANKDSEEQLQNDKLLSDQVEDGSTISLMVYEA